MQDQMQHMPEYEVLNPAQHEELNGHFAGMSETLQTQELAVSIRDKVNAFGRDQYPRILTRLHETAAEYDSDPRDPGSKEPSVEFINIREIPVESVKSILVNESDVADYVEAVRYALLEAIRANKRINL